MVRHKVYKNIKLENQTKQPFLLKVMYKEQRSEYMTPFASHSGLRTLEITRTLYHSVFILCMLGNSFRSFNETIIIHGNVTK